MPYDPDLKKRSQENRKNATKEEKKLWYDCLQGIKPQFYRQRIIDHYIADFYCPELKLVIEVDGDSHLSEMGIGNDSVRTSVLEGYGLRIIRFTNKEVTENFEVVKKVIYDLINSRN